MANLPKLFSELTKARMLAGHIDQKKLAARLNVRPPAVSQILSNGNCRLSTLEAIADALECEPWELLKPQEPPAPPAPPIPANSNAQSASALDLIALITQAKPEQLYAIVAAVEAVLGPIPPSGPRPSKSIR